MLSSTNLDLLFLFFFNTIAHIPLIQLFTQVMPATHSHLSGMAQAGLHTTNNETQAFKSNF